MDASNQYVNDMTFPLLVQKLRERRCLIDPGWLGGWVAGRLGGSRSISRQAARSGPPPAVSYRIPLKGSCQAVLRAMPTVIAVSADTTARAVCHHTHPMPVGQRDSRRPMT
jgi:hypothetical protein